MGYTNYEIKEILNELIVSCAEKFKGILDIYHKGNYTEDFKFNFYTAMYWLCSDYHSGQSSLGYAILSHIRYSPAYSIGSIMDEPSEDVHVMYDYLKRKISKKL